MLPVAASMPDRGAPAYERMLAEMRLRPLNRTNALRAPVPNQRTHEYGAVSQHTCWLRRHAARISDGSARHAPDPSVLADVYDKPHLLRSLGASNAVSVTILRDRPEWPRRGPVARQSGVIIDYTAPHQSFIPAGLADLQVLDSSV